MTDDEWKTCAGFMEQGWTGEFDENKRTAYRFFLDKFETDVLLAALAKLAETGSRHLPAVPEIVQGCRAVEQEQYGGGEVPGWSEVYRDLIRALSVRVGYFDSDGQKTETAKAWLEQHSHPVVVAFFAAEGGYGQMQDLGLLDDEWGSARRSQLRDRWEQFVGTARERLAAGHALETVGARKQLGPRTLDKVALLETVGGGERPELEPGTSEG